MLDNYILRKIRKLITTKLSVIYIYLFEITIIKSNPTFFYKH